MVLVPRLFLPLVVPGVRLPVLIDPADPQRLVPDWEAFGTSGSPTERHWAARPR